MYMLFGFQDERMKLKTYWDKIITDIYNNTIGFDYKTIILRHSQIKYLSTIYISKVHRLSTYNSLDYVVMPNLTLIAENKKLY